MTAPLPAPVRSFLDAVRDRRVDRVADCFTEQATYAYAVPLPPLEGRTAIADMFEGLLREAERVQWDVLAAAVDGPRVWLERVDRFWFDGREVAIECAGVVELDGDRICAVRDYVDLQTWRARRGAA